MSSLNAANVKDIIPTFVEDKTDMIAATSVLVRQAAEIRPEKVGWQSYVQSQMISNEDYQFIIAFDAVEGEAKNAFLKDPKLRAQCAQTFLNLLSHVSKDKTIQSILIMIDDLLQEDKARVNIFREHAQSKKESLWSPFLNLLNRQDGFTQHMASRIIAKIACWNLNDPKDVMEKKDLNFYLTWLKDQLKINAEEVSQSMKKTETRLHAADKPHQQPLEFYHPLIVAIDELAPTTSSHLGNQYIQSVARCLQMMLRIDEYRFAFVTVDGISTLLSILSSRVNFQVQYQLVFCLWVLTFNTVLAAKMNKFNVIPTLADILSDSVKEKVTRIVLAVFRNLIEKPEEPQVAKEHCIAMVQCKVLKQLSILEQKRSDDEDIMADVEFLNERLQASVQDLSSFDEYASEVKSGRLEWSPVHKSAKFWRENAARLSEKGGELLKTLIYLLHNTDDTLVLAVACYDVGEYVRHYPRGKHVIEQLGGKQHVMNLLIHEDPNVRYEALLAVQKLMVHNWEYLGKQLEKETNGPPSGKNQMASTVGAKA